MGLTAFLRHDISQALRTLRHSPGFTVLSVLILAFGIGTNGAIFSILNALVLREVPAPRPDRLVQLAGSYRNGSNVPLSFPMFRELQRGQRVFSSLFGWSGLLDSTVDSGGVPFRAGIRVVTGTYFSELGAAPQLGRLLAPEDDTPDAPSHVAVLGYPFWKRRFSQDPGVVGHVIRIDGRPFTIIGVTRPRFTGMNPGEAPDVIIPAVASPFDLEDRSALWIFATGRLRDGVALGQARAQLASFWPALLQATVPTHIPGPRLQSFLSMSLNAEPAATGVSAELRARFVRPLWIVMAIAGLILVIICVNLASLMLARASARTQEVSIRIALGAGTRDIIRQFVTESLLLSITGALFGLVFAEWGGRLLVNWISSGALLPVVLDTHPDARVFSLTVLAAAATGILIGLVPAWHCVRGDLASLLRGTQRTFGRGTGRLAKALIITQIALSMVLLQGAGILLRTLTGLRSVDPGYEQEGVLGMRLYLRTGTDRDLETPAYRRQMIARVAALPGVRAVASGSMPVPAGELGWKETVTPAAAEHATSILATLDVVSPDFFKVLGIPLVSGRPFDETDDDQHPRVAIVDENLARRLGTWSAASASRVSFGVQPSFQDLRVVGVVRSARLVDLRDSAAPVIYVPYAQHASYGGNGFNGYLFIRGAHPSALAAPVDRAIRSAGHEYSANPATLGQTIDRALFQARATALLAVFFAAVALVLTGIGLFALMSGVVSRRTREVGIRMALGSRPHRILWLILGETFLLALTGAAIGTLCAFASAQLAGRIVFAAGVDPAALAAGVALLLGTAAIAGYLPARRAMNLEPLTALRQE